MALFPALPRSGLLALGNVIVALAGEPDPAGKAGGEKKAAKHVPYRDSKLTRLLQVRGAARSAAIAAAGTLSSMREWDLARRGSGRVGSVLFMRRDPSCGSTP